MIFPLFVLAIIGGSLALPADDLQLQSSSSLSTLISSPKYGIFGQANRFDGSKICASNDMRLIVINNQNKGDDVTYYVDKVAAISGPFMTSVSRLADGKTWAFEDGTPVKYFNWAAGEPNNSGGNEECVELYRDGYWNDISCNNIDYVLCEYR